jgi:hypothetical protein
VLTGGLACIAGAVAVAAAFPALVRYGEEPVEPVLEGASD